MSKEAPNVLHCPDCRGQRLHYVRLSHEKGEKGQRVRVRVLACSGCEAEREIPATESVGIVCRNPKCRDTRFRTVYVRHRLGATVRKKVCKGCGRAIRTCEKIESA